MSEYRESDNEDMFSGEDEEGEESDVINEEDEGDILVVPERKRKLVSPVWNCGAATISIFVSKLSNHN